jgi:hypothetical protein
MTCLCEVRAPPIRQPNGYKPKKSNLDHNLKHPPTVEGMAVLDRLPVGPRAISIFCSVEFHIREDPMVGLVDIAPAVECIEVHETSVKCTESRRRG